MPSQHLPARSRRMLLSSAAVPESVGRLRIVRLEARPTRSLRTRSFPSWSSSRRSRYLCTKQSLPSMHLERREDHCWWLYRGHPHFEIGGGRVPSSPYSTSILEQIPPSFRRKCGDQRPTMRMCFSAMPLVGPTSPSRDSQSRIQIPPPLFHGTQSILEPSS